MSRRISPVVLAGALGMVLGGCPEPFPAFSGDPPDVCSGSCGPIVDLGPTADVGPTGDRGPIDAMAVDDMAPIDAASADEGPVGLDAGDAEPVDAEPIDMQPIDVSPIDVSPIDMLPIDAAPPPPEACNGIDDDLDGAVDEGPICGGYVAENCGVTVSWAWGNTAGQERTAGYAQCAADGELVDDGRIHCVKTTATGRFRALAPSRSMFNGDYFGLRFSCADVERPAVAAWVESHCRVHVGHAYVDPGRSETFGACPEGNGVDNNQWCIRTDGGDQHWQGQPEAFRGGSFIGVAFTCDDAAQPARARGVEQAVRLFVGWAADCPSDQSARWGPCPGQPVGAAGDTVCNSTTGDRRFATVEVTETLGFNGCLGIALDVAAP